MNPVLALLTMQALLGAFDHVWNHEINERLPSKRSAATEITLHSARDFIYGLVFIQLGWLEPHGAWAALFAAMLGIEILITLTDFVVEDRTRRLPAGERILHTVLAINFGMFLVLFAPLLRQWWHLPSEYAAVHHGAWSDLFALFALGAFAFGTRNALAALKLRRPPEWVRDPIETHPNTNARTVLLSGGTGFIGGHLIRRLIARSERVIVLTRDKDRALDRFGPQVRVVATLAELQADERIDAIVNLAGAPILGFPWTQARRQQLINSRVNTTRAVLGTGKQWVAWIHIDDLVRLYEFALDTPSCKGAMNAVSPAAATHEQMQRLLAKVVHRPLWLRAPAFLIRSLLGEMSQLLVDGQRVVPTRALRSGFVFRYPNLGTALEQLLGHRSTLTQQAQIYYNGDCPVCRTEMEHYAAVCATTHPELHFIDSTQLPQGLTSCGLRREHLERRVYVRDSDGNILSGMPAIIALWLKMPGYECLAKVFSLPVIRPASVVLYDHVIAPTLAWWARTRARRRATTAH
jgi:NAD dependent epimerase/dehydratase family enzyme/predicted DCC family thiol-disulfide oxidoreductase YuxK